ncbi:MAG TPA: alpha/beta hydrolase [Actinomycetes bacterium]|nr:alpha/beta hydrolase [Actinomycetes bacterium]
MRRLVALATGAALALGLLVVATPAGATGGTSASAKLASTLAWKSCTDPDMAGSGALCATLKVPLDWKHPSGPTISLALSMVRHTSSAAAYQGVMLANPGGPGDPGRWLATEGGNVPDGVGDTYDWVGFDPRGVGASRPLLRCIPDYFRADRPDYRPTTPALVKTWLHRSAAYATACGKHGGALLAHVSTVDTVQDMDAIRRALGVGTMSFYGFSYGTYLGQVYATLHPTRVYRMVLDSNVDPRRVWYDANLDQDVAFEKTMAAWFTWIASHHATYDLGRSERSVKRLFYAQMNALVHKPAGGVVGPDEWNDLFLEAGYYTSTWVELADAFARWVHKHKADELIDEYEATDTPGDDNAYAMYNAVQCLDAPWPKLWSTWKRDNDRVNKVAPLITWGNAWYNMPCRTWPVKSGHPVHVSGAKAPPVLLIDETLDAATPYTGSLWVRHLFPKSRLVAVVGGTSHANSLNGNACVDDAVARYLRNGALPTRRPGAGHADKSCRPLPLPSPVLDALQAHASPFARLGKVPVGLL